MAMERDVVEGNESAYCTRISWSAIVAGVILALGIQIALSILGAAFGLSAIAPGRAAAIGMGSAIWWIITGIISLFFGGMISARFSCVINKAEGGLQGLLMWALAAVVSVFVVTTSIGSLIGGGLGMIGQGIAATGKAAVAGVATQASEKGGSFSSPLELIQQQMDTSTQPNPENTMSAIGATSDFLQNPDDPTKKENLISSFMKNGMSRQDAENRVNRIAQDYSTFRQQAGSMAATAENAAIGAGHVAGKAAWMAFFTLLIGALAAYWGGTRGALYVGRTVA